MSEVDIDFARSMRTANAASVYHRKIQLRSKEIVDARFGCSGVYQRIQSWNAWHGRRVRCDPMRVKADIHYESGSPSD